MYKKDCLGKQREGGKERVLGGEDDQSMYVKYMCVHIYICIQNIMEGVTLFQVHCTLLQNYHNKIPSYYQYIL
jgi:hypothetical protein